MNPEPRVHIRLTYAHLVIVPILSASTSAFHHYGLFTFVCGLQTQLAVNLQLIIFIQWPKLNFKSESHFNLEEDCCWWLVFWEPEKKQHLQNPVTLKMASSWYFSVNNDSFFFQFILLSKIKFIINYGQSVWLRDQLTNWQHCRSYWKPSADWHIGQGVPKPHMIRNSLDSILSKTWALLISLFHFNSWQFCSDLSELLVGTSTALDHILYNFIILACIAWSMVT